MTKPLTHAAAVAKSREKSGAKGVNISMLPEERALLDALADRYGGIKPAVMAGLRALEGLSRREKYWVALAGDAYDGISSRDPSAREAGAAALGRLRESMVAATKKATP